MVKLELVLEPDEADLILRAVDRAREVHAEQAESPQPGKAETVEPPKAMTFPRKEAVARPGTRGRILR
jgi:hypothetical protein